MIGLAAVQGARASAGATVPAAGSGVNGAPGWQDFICWQAQESGPANGAPRWQALLFWQGEDGGGLWACPWCGKKDNAGWALLCPACGYPAWNPGGYLVRPVDTDIVTGGYAPGHRAVDFGAREGLPVYAAEDGVVVETRKDRWAGNVVRVEHEDGLQTLYGHLQEIATSPGCLVRAGMVIARSGSTGAVTGPHLHFELSVRGAQVDPLTRLAP